MTDEPEASEPFAQSLRTAVMHMHKASSLEAIRYPSAEGAFPHDILHKPPPVVLDANRLRSDILRACRTNQRTVLVNAANGGLLRLFCAQHVIDEVAEHSGDWTIRGPVFQNDFMRKWLLEYLPLIRVIPPSEDYLALLTPPELARIRRLSDQDPDDVPSAIIALLLQAFYLSNDRSALRAVYGDNADLSEHAEWVNALKVGGDAGELGKMLNLLANLTQLSITGIACGIKRLAAATSPWLLLIAAGIAIFRIMSASDEIRQKTKIAGLSMLTNIGSALLMYREVQERFQRVVPVIPSWESMADTNPPGTILARACLHTLARSPMSPRSAEELAKEVPYIHVPQGEAKVRSVLRSIDCFTEIWRGRWQVGHVVPALKPYLKHTAQP